MNTATFAEQIRAMSDRLGSLYTGVTTASLSSGTLLSAALKELGIASERLQIAAEMMHRQGQELGVSEQAAAVERQRYQDLLEFVPDACLTTDAAGVVQEANRAAADLLGIKSSLLGGKLLERFITPETQRHFQTQIEQLRQQTWRQEWQVRLQTHQGDTLDAIAIVRAVDRPTDASPTLHWILRRATSQPLPDPPSDSLYSYRTLQHYHKGDIIPLELQAIWQVCQGLVKLTTFSSSGEELLAGIAGALAPFGPTLVASPLYQAIALTDTQLWCIPLTEIAVSPTLAQSLLPHMERRVRQSETLLAIYGQQRVEDRLAAFLLFLKQEIGEPVPEGVRLPVRFTHEELASACRTTRVSVTRTLGQFAQQQKIKVDAKQHLILL